MSYQITELGSTCAASFWYPTMLTQEAGEISESKAAELLGMNIEDYRMAKYKAIRSVMDLIENLPSPLDSLLGIVDNKPEFFNE